MPASRHYTGGSPLVGMSESERDWDEFDPKAREEREMGREMVDKARGHCLVQQSAFQVYRKSNRNQSN
jgi:hypothetical protein